MIPLLIEPGYEQTHWAKMYLHGIRDEANRLGRALVSIEPEQTGVAPIIVLGSSSSWLSACFEYLSKRQTPFVLAGAPPPTSLCSFSCPDYELTVAQFERISSQLGTKKRALFACHPGSSSDTMKRSAFERIFPGDPIAQNDGDLLLCTHQFCKQIDDIGAVLCVNDVSAMILRRTLAGLKKDIDIFTFGDQSLPDHESIHVFRMDLVQAGRQACRILRKLEKPPAIRQCAWIPCQLDSPLSESLHRPITESNSLSTAMSFYEDPQVPEIFRFKALLDTLDSLDLDILRELLATQRYTDMVDTLHTTDSTIKYRLKRMQHNAGVSSRDALLALAKSYFSSTEL